MDALVADRMPPPHRYWYSARTLDAIVAEVDEVATRAAFLSTPSVYFSLRNKELRERSFLFEVSGGPAARAERSRSRP